MKTVTEMTINGATIDPIKDSEWLELRVIFKAEIPAHARIQDIVADMVEVMQNGKGFLFRHGEFVNPNE